MGRARCPAPVKLIAGLLAREVPALEAGCRLLAERFGALERCSAPEPFSHSRYYEAEMGGPLVRLFCSFACLIDAAELPRIKRTTNDLEALRLLAASGGRRINLDPGYLAVDKVVLATTKGAAHRPYLGLGIYAELTYVYRSGAFDPLSWTYPDYRQPHVREFFAAVRRGYLTQLRTGHAPRP
ncbi:MAG: DUF4416 family protein [Candidatus Tectomicrobia bacterium]|nr:DUF4416 family protein [Candidatus Tectomicrobia bacterium]